MPSHIIRYLSAKVAAAPMGAAFRPQAPYTSSFPSAGTGNPIGAVPSTYTTQLAPPPRIGGGGSAGSLMWTHRAPTQPATSYAQAPAAYPGQGRLPSGADRPDLTFGQLARRYAPVSSRTPQQAQNNARSMAAQARRQGLISDQELEEMGVLNPKSRLGSKRSVGQVSPEAEAKIRARLQEYSDMGVGRRATGTMRMKRPDGTIITQTTAGTQTVQRPGQPAQTVKVGSAITRLRKLAQAMLNPQPMVPAPQAPQLGANTQPAPGKEGVTPFVAQLKQQLLSRTQPQGIQQ